MAMRDSQRLENRESTFKFLSLEYKPQFETTPARVFCILVVFESFAFATCVKRQCRGPVCKDLKAAEFSTFCGGKKRGNPLCNGASPGGLAFRPVVNMKLCATCGLLLSSKELISKSGRIRLISRPVARI